MDRNSVIGLILIGAIIIGFTIWSSPDRDELAKQQYRADSLAYLQQQAALEAKKNQQNASLDEKKDTLSEAQKEKALEDSYGDFASAGVGKQQFYIMENEFLRLVVTNKGGKPYSVELKKYKTFDKKPLILFEGDSSVLGLKFSTQNNRIIATNDLFFSPVSADTFMTLNSNDTAKSFALRLHAGDQKYIEYIYTIKPNSYKVDFRINFVNMESVISTNISEFDLNWNIVARAQEKVKKNENTYTGIYYKYSLDEVEKFELGADDTEKQENLRNKIKWIAYKDQFFSSVLIAGSTFENATISAKNFNDSSLLLKGYKSEIGVAFQNAKSQQVDLSFYFGPNHYQTLKKYKLDLEELVAMGSWIIKWINRYLIIPIFNFLNIYILNYGIIILLLTIIIKLLLFPLTYKSYLSMAKMRVLKPQVDEINERIPASKAMERQQAVMHLYRKVGVNPLGGCLPLLLQMPILIAMFQFFPTSIELRQQGFLWAKDLSSYDAVITWNANIPLISSTFGNHLSLFNLLMTITTIFTIQMNNQANASQTQIPGMKVMMYLMPVVFMFVLNSFSSGLTYYYFLANLITIVQNEIFKRSINEEKLLHQLNENKKKPVKKSSFQAKLEEAAKKRGYKTK